MSWGKGWEVGIRKAIWQQERAREVAAEILRVEHGKQHVAGSRPDLCPLCAPNNSGASVVEGQGSPQ